MLGQAEAAHGGGVYVVVPDLDGHCARARDAGAEIVREPNDTDYGSREYGARDPEGLAWHFGTYQPFAIEPTAPELEAYASSRNSTVDSFQPRSITSPPAPMNWSLRTNSSNACLSANSNSA